MCLYAAASVYYVCVRVFRIDTSTRSALWARSPLVRCLSSHACREIQHVCLYLLVHVNVHDMHSFHALHTINIRRPLAQGPDGGAGVQRRRRPRGRCAGAGVPVRSYTLSCSLARGCGWDGMERGQGQCTGCDGRRGDPDANAKCNNKQGPGRRRARQGDRQRGARALPDAGAAVPGGGGALGGQADAGLCVFVSDVSL